MTFLLFDFFFFGRDSPASTVSLALPLPLTSVLVWAFLLVPLAQPSLLETFLRLSPFPATCLLLPAGPRSQEQLLPHTQPPRLPSRQSSFLCKFKEPTSSFSPSKRPHLLVVPCSGLCGLPQEEDVLACVCVWGGGGAKPGQNCLLDLSRPERRRPEEME